MVNRIRGAWWATAVLFLVHGLVVASWISRIPAVQSTLGLNNFTLGLTFFGSALGALCAIPITGVLIGRAGSKGVCLSASAAFCASLVLPALARNALTLGVALFLFGGLAAAMDVAMNAHGVEVEDALGRPTMSRFHAMFSLGAMLGAAIGGAAAARGLGTAVHFAVSAGLNSLALLAIAPLLLDTHDAHTGTDQRLPFRRMPRVLLALSAIGFCILLSEGAMADWTALYLRQVLQAGPGTAALGYSVFSAAMTGMRLLGDMVTLRLGPLRAVRIGSVVGGMGLACALAVSKVSWAMLGLAVVGCGFSVIIPLVFGSAGRVKGVAAGAGIATVSGLGYLGFIAGPPVIGLLSQWFTLRWALFAVVFCCGASALLAGQMKALELGRKSVAEPQGFGVTGHL